MNDEELEKIAELLFQKLIKREQEYYGSGELPIDWVPDNTSGTWYNVSFSGSNSGQEILMQRLVALNIEKQELIEKENYEELIKLQKRIDEIKEQLKKYKD